MCWKSNFARRWGWGWIKIKLHDKLKRNGNMNNLFIKKHGWPNGPKQDSVGVGIL